MMHLHIYKQGNADVSKKTRKHYSITELLKGAALKNIKALKKKTKWFRNNKSIGRELY